MNREIKFRTWDATHQEMRYPEGVVTNGWIVDNCDIRMQYTGLKDKNGAEIYEGDIANYAVKKKICPDCSKKDITSDLFLGGGRFCNKCGTATCYNDFITTCIVEYRKGGFAYYKQANHEHYNSWPVTIAESYISWVEVIGNIHQHAHLLNQSK